MEFATVCCDSPRFTSRLDRLYFLVGPFGHDGSYFFNDYRRTKHHPMEEQIVPESLDYQEKVDVTSRIVG